MAGGAGRGRPDGYQDKEWEKEGGCERRQTHAKREGKVSAARARDRVAVEIED